MRIAVQSEYKGSLLPRCIQMPHTRIPPNAHRHDGFSLIRHLRREINVPGGQKRQSFEFISRAEIQNKFSSIINLDLSVKPEDDKEKE